MLRRKGRVLAAYCSFFLAAQAPASPRIGTVIISPLSSNTGSNHSFSGATAQLHQDLIRQVVTEPVDAGITMFCCPIHYSAKGLAHRESSAHYQLHYCLSSELPDETAQQIYDSFPADEIDTAGIANSQSPPGSFNVLALWLSERVNVLSLFYQSPADSIQAIPLDLDKTPDTLDISAPYHSHSFNLTQGSNHTDEATIPWTPSNGQPDALVVGAGSASFYPGDDKPGGSGSNTLMMETITLPDKLLSPLGLLDGALFSLKTQETLTKLFLNQHPGHRGPVTLSDLASALWGSKVLSEKNPHIMDELAEESDLPGHLHTIPGKKAFPDLWDYPTPAKPEALMIFVVGSIEGNSSLITAAHRGDIARITQLLETGQADVNAQDSGGCTALHMALIKRNSKLIKQLLRQRGIRLDLKNLIGFSAFDLLTVYFPELAAEYVSDPNVSVEVLQALMELSVKKEHSTLIDPKKSATAIKMVQLASQRGVNFRGMRGQGDSLFHIAVGNNWLEAIELIYTPQDLDSLDSLGNSALAITGYYGHSEMAKKLLALGASSTLKSGKTTSQLPHETAEKYARRDNGHQGHRKTAKVLKAHYDATIAQQKAQAFATIASEEPSSPPDTATPSTHHRGRAFFSKVSSLFFGGSKTESEPETEADATAAPYDPQERAGHQRGKAASATGHSAKAKFLSVLGIKPKSPAEEAMPLLDPYVPVPKYTKSMPEAQEPKAD